MDLKLLAEEYLHVSLCAGWAYGVEVGLEPHFGNEGSLPEVVSWVGDVYHHLALEGVEGLKCPIVFCCAPGIPKGRLLGPDEVGMGLTLKSGGVCVCVTLLHSMSNEGTSIFLRLRQCTG